MQIITTYNAISSGFDIPIGELANTPNAVHGILDDFRLLTEWDARLSIASGGTAALAADSLAGEATLTPNATGGCHLELKTEAFQAQAGKPVFMLARVKFNAAGNYFVGLTQKVAVNSAVISANAITAGTGAGFVVKTDNNVNLVGRDTTPTATSSADKFTIVADTYYNLGIALSTNSAEFYINAKKVGQVAIAAGLGSGSAANVCPSFEALTNAKVMTVDYAVVCQER